MLTDDQIAERLRSTSANFRELQEVHHQLDVQLQELQKNHILNPQEELLKKQIQKQKLGKKDQMALLIREYRNEQEKPAAS